MKLDPSLEQRMKFLVRVVQKEQRHLAVTDSRLFASPFTLARAGSLEDNPELAEQVEAFVGRFCRLQDTVGDKLLPFLLTILGEKPSSLIDNLDRAEKLGWLDSADEWLIIRKLRNQMVHEYVEDLAILTSAMQSAHAYVAVLDQAAGKMIDEIARRGWA